MVKENRSIAKWSTDLDILTNSQKEAPLFWTAPKWLTEGDVMFFYHAKRAKVRTNRLLAEAQNKFPNKRSLINLLKRAKDTADLYSGSIFACASISGTTERFEKQKKHFVSRLFAPLNEIYVFKKPLEQELFSDYVKIGLSTITPLYRKEFSGIKRLLAKQNDLPAFLQNVVIGDKVFKNINDKNWRSISCLPDTKFINEGQLRSYLIDFFLNEIKDTGTTLLEECECFRGKHNTGRVDYFIKIFGQWLPVEAKLNISREKDIFTQVAKYTNIDSFSPRKGSYRNKIFNVNRIPICLILDQLGIYFISATGEFINSDFDSPFIKREQFTRNMTSRIREELKII